MKTYADYAFFIEQYGGAMDEESFRKAIIGASQYIRYITMNRSDNTDAEEIKYAACAVADVYYSTIIAEENGNSKALGKKSETIDGYSVTYVTDRADGETAEIFFKKKAYEAVKQWLGPIGLLYKGARHRC